MAHIVVAALPQIPPRNVNWSSTAYEKYFMDRLGIRRLKG
jgi:hypothetical protein